MMDCNEYMIRTVQVAAADLESAEYERDQAAVLLQETVARAAAAGTSATAIAEAAGMELTEVLKVARSAWLQDRASLDGDAPLNGIVAGVPARELFP